MNENRHYKNLHPTEDRLLVKPEDISEISKGGIYIPRSKADRRISAGRGTVLAKGPGRLINHKYVPTSCEVGDLVSFGEYAGTEIKHNEEDLLLMNWVEVLCVYPASGETTSEEPEVAVPETVEAEA